jgi:hypothetical protein
LNPGVPADTEPAIAIERARPKPAKRVDFFMFISCLLLPMIRLDCQYNGAQAVALTPSASYIPRLSNVLTL